MFTIDIGENKTEQKSYVLLLPADTFLFIAENMLLAVIVPLVYFPPPTPHHLLMFLLYLL